MIFNVSGGGGTALNFRVVGGTTAPANPAENCIWVNTDTPITSWLFSATEPTPAESGMVWISTGISSPGAFNALKKNGIQVYPLKAQQYVGGALVDVEAKSYQGGEWEDWFTYLYDVGNVFEELTGGYNSFLNQGGGYARVDADGMHFQTIRTGSYYYPSSGLSTVKQIDFTKYKTITAKGTLERNGNGGSFWARLSPNPDGDMSNEVAIVYYGEDGDFELSLDIQNVTGSYYFKVGTIVNQDQGGGTPEATVTKIWME